MAGMPESEILSLPDETGVVKAGCQFCNKEYTFTVEDFVQTVLAEQSTALEQIPGVGKKTAQRMMVDLKDSIKKFADNTQQVLTPATATTTNTEAFNDAIAALSALGYREADAIKTVKLVLKEHSDFNTQDLIKAALALISKR